MDSKEIQTEAGSITKTIALWIQDFLIGLGVPEQGIIYTKLIVLFALVVIIVLCLQYLLRRILLFVFHRAVNITKLSFINYTIENRLPHYLALIGPYSFVRGTIPVIFYDFHTMITPMLKATDVYMVFMVIWIIMSIVRSFGGVLQEKPAFQNKPMKSYFQVVQIVLFIFGAVVIYSILTGKSATTFFAAMGAASAILMLLFQDSIKGFAGSIQVTTNNMVQIGDWITMNKYGADGNVEEINLTTVKIRNFDKTITTVPTYALISDSFQNWRGMQDSGGRRFRRALNIKHNTIRFLTDDELEKYKEIDGLKEYITAKQKEFSKMPKREGLLSNMYRITNSDLFLQYGIYYLRNHPRIDKNLTLLVRQLPPGPQGLPIELYTFTNTTVWAEYELILSEIVNHFIGIVKYFDLTIFEESSGSDIFDVYIKENVK
ncbi:MULTISPECIES: mechanosensitive ion channel family protein [Dysgonomonas]|uniref:Mechanosensing system component YbdG n=2 Tax=Dysgonomonas TaxID=156973 RepID=A0A4Y9IP61_9BACT|nr:MULTISPECIES: mechanosensitive ion channel domain-containing protein [Dysgonomonas]MBF0761125.1 mechanosensitive ion channel [Dysgonomonas mossii]MBN9300804.1 mechanosensitive ion channel [Dysgonomonas mossii]MBS5906356.1 mechanosensitive ion channel [Dysgonomonas mossii]OJX65576.1 MAG: mechanosensitive ion channel protein MscS [Dysgonomonas sp. 37-18]TFU90082.1 mechanosensitive ion channel [Dysgonomonas mossii]